MSVGVMLVDLCISSEDKILKLIGQQAQWEVPLHALLYNKLQKRGHNPRRERKYQGSKEKVDLLISYDGTEYAIEIKVESATHPGQINEASFNTREGEIGTAMTEIVADDIAKVQGFYNYAESPNPNAINLVLLLGYSATAQLHMTAIKDDQPPSQFGQGKTTFDHKGPEGQGAKNGKGSKLTVAVYYADYY
jgi:hypothetical protein